METTLTENTKLSIPGGNLPNRHQEVEQVINFKKEPVRLYLGSDLGGTDSRTGMLYPNTEIDDSHIIITPSGYSIIDPDDEDSDTSIIKSLSNRIEDNLELIIQEDKNSAYIDHSLFEEPVHVLKGSLLDISNEIPDFINNQHDKIDSIGIFVNHLTNVAIAAYKNKLLDVYLNTGITLPVGERYSTTERITEFLKRVAGTYTIKLPRLDYTVRVTIDLKDIVLESEAETAFLYLAYTHGEEEIIQKAMTRNIVMNDMGRTTYNKSLISNGSAISGKSHTSKFGGDNLISALHVALGKKFKEAIDLEQAEKALRTGYLELGAESRPVGPEVTAAKKEIVKRMIQANIQFLQGANMQSTQIYLNVFLGRTMGSTGTVEEVDGELVYSPNFSPSIGELFTKSYKKYSKSSQGFIISNAGSATLLGLLLALTSDWNLNE